VTFRQQLLSSPNCCLLSSARGRHREQQIVVDVAQLVGPLVSVHDTLKKVVRMLYPVYSSFYCLTTVLMLNNTAFLRPQVMQKIHCRQTVYN